jgi:hypothetical protein
MKRTNLLRLFDEANKLWYKEGRTNQALEIYRKALKHDPTHAVILFQLARVLRAFGQIGQAREALALAEKHIDRLSALGKKMLDEEKQKLFGSSPIRYSLPVANSELDIERLEAKGLSTNQWFEIALTAEEREMFGVAANAYERSSGSFIDFELGREQEKMKLRAENALALLDKMRAETEEQDQKNELETPPLSSTTSIETGGSMPANHVQESPTQPLSQQNLPSQPREGSSPLNMEISVNPQQSAIGDQIWLNVVLTNISEQVVAINKRMLLNRPNTPPGYGEIFLNVEGPPDYQNQVRFSIRAGLLTEDQFSLLSPRKSVEKTYRLWKYESLHLPGNYKIQVSYRNTVERKVKGMPVFVGSISSEAISLVRI